MKVKDLIEELKKFPEDLDVLGMSEDLEYGLDINQGVDVYTATVKNYKWNLQFDTHFQIQ